MIYKFDFNDESYEAELDVDYTPGRDATGPSMDNAGGDPPEPPDWDIEVKRVWKISELRQRVVVDPFDDIEEYLQGDGADDVLEEYLDGLGPDCDAINDERRELREMHDD